MFQYSDIQIKEQSDHFNLRVITNDEASEIFVLNSLFERVDRKVGNIVTFRLPSGLYTVKVKTAGSVQEKKVRLLDGDTEVNFDPAIIPSSAPLPTATKFKIHHKHEAATYSRNPHISPGVGCQIFIFCSEKDMQLTPIFTNAAKGLKLCLSDNVTEIKLDDPVFSSQLDSEPWTACNIQVNPGVHTLCLTNNFNEVFEMSIVACQGWQTQVFLSCKNYFSKRLREKSEPKADRKADLATASIFMRRIGEGFPLSDSNSHDMYLYRLAEIAKQAMIKDRSVVTEQMINDMLDDKFASPMLGIYSVHLLLLDKLTDPGRIVHVIDTLRRILVTPHPDVEALGIKAGVPSGYQFFSLPMLVRSWTYVLEAASKNESLVPESSSANDTSGAFWSEEPWLIWGYTDSRDKAKNSLVEEMKKVITSTNWDDWYQQGIESITAQADMPKDVQADLSNKTFQPLTITDEQYDYLVKMTQLPKAHLKSLIKNYDLGK